MEVLTLIALQRTQKLMEQGMSKEQAIDAVMEEMKKDMERADFEAHCGLHDC